MSLSLKGNNNRLSPKVIIGMTIAAIIILYGLYEGFNLLCGPKLVIYSPQDGQSLNDSLVKVKGQTKRIAKMSINGRQVFADANGNFNEPLLLGYGYNIIQVKVSDQFNRQIIKTLTVTLN